MQIGDQLAGHAKSELDAEVTSSSESWMGASAQADIGALNLEAVEEESPKTITEKDDADDVIENQHSLKEMDSGDVLAYSGEISGEF